mmetsp:Transcript_89689/g.267531  ORF Transcript_89689/g.267531 Transcript_89689/m.267531 type:complete len:204 (+) Transcript_89689:373-984(+)
MLHTFSSTALRECFAVALTQPFWTTMRPISFEFGPLNPRYTWFWNSGCLHWFSTYSSLTALGSGNSRRIAAGHVAEARPESQSTNGPSHGATKASGKQAFSIDMPTPRCPRCAYVQGPHPCPRCLEMLPEAGHGTTHSVVPHDGWCPRSWTFQLHPAGQLLQSLADAQSGLAEAGAASAAKVRRAVLIPKWSAVTYPRVCGGF